MTITIFTQSILPEYYPRETGAPQNRLSDLAPDEGPGHEITVLTPNYPTGTIRIDFRGGLWKAWNQIASASSDALSSRRAAMWYWSPRSPSGGLWVQWRDSLVLEFTRP